MKTVTKLIRKIIQHHPLQLFIRWRRHVLLKRLAPHIKFGALEYATASYLSGRCLGKPLDLWERDGACLVKGANATVVSPKFHLDIWCNRVLVDDTRFLSGRAYVIYPFGLVKTVAIS